MPHQYVDGLRVGSDPVGPDHETIMRAALRAFRADQEWDAMCARGLSFPEYDGPSYFSRIEGDCLEPLVTKKHLARCRALSDGETIVDGGLYIIEWENADDVREFCKSQGIVHREGEPFLVSKFVRRIGPEYYIHARGNYIAPLTGTLVGRIVGLPGGAPAYTGKLASNAATAILTSSLSGSAGSFTTPSSNGSITVGPFPTAVSVILTVTGQWQFSFTGGTPTNIVLRYGISAVSSISFTGALITVDQATSASSSVTGLGPLSQEIEVALAVNTTVTYNVLSGENPSGIIGTAINITGTIKAEVIKK